MVRRPLRLRLLAAALALCLGPALVGPPWLHACPMHDGAVAQASAVSGMPGMAAVPGHASGGHAGDGQPGRSEKGSHPCCTCIGLCAGAGAAPAPPAPSVVALAREVLPRLPFAASPAPRTSAHLTLLPFGTAPPIA